MQAFIGRLVLYAALAVPGLAASASDAVNARGAAEARLVQVYRWVGAGDTRRALAHAQSLVRDFPNFQLAQLVHGDLLMAHARPLRRMGDVPDDLALAGAESLQDLRREAELRLAGLAYRPAPGAIPAQFLSLSPANRHAIAVDVSRARLYLFENRNGELRLLTDFYISVGKAGVGKAVEGDKRTPLGVYFVTSNLDRRRLTDFYGSGALPINYPNAYDVRRGRGGSGIWLHGSPPTQYARAPQATDGCVAVANPDLEHILRTVQIRTTPVLIAQQISWVPPRSLASEKQSVEKMLDAWSRAKSGGYAAALAAFYAPDFSADGRDLTAHQAMLNADAARLRGRTLALKDVSILGWSEGTDVRVVTFAEVAAGARTGTQTRQYWERRGAGWKIVYETELR
jgi:murein L,D-transpeptidase YafK